MYLNSNTNMEPPLFRNTAILGVHVNYSDKTNSKCMVGIRNPTSSSHNRL